MPQYHEVEPENALDSLENDKNDEVVVPRTRTEHFLGRIAGDPNAKELAPRTRREHFLNEIAENGGSGGGSGGGGDDVVNIAITINTDNTVTTEATFSQLYNIINEGKKIRALIEKKNQGGNSSTMYEVLDYSYVGPGHGYFYFYIWTSVQTGPRPTPALGTIGIFEDGGSTSYSVTAFTVS